jgi:hypothetical protein
LIIWRSPVAICRSIAQASRTAPWFRRRGTMLRALLGCEKLKRDCERLKRRGHSVHELTYGQLTANPQETCAAICRFLEIPYDARMASLDGADRSAVYEGEHHARLRSEAIRPSNAPADALAPAMKAKIDRYLAGWAASEGEEWLLMRDAAPPALSPPSTFERIADRLAYACLRGWDATVMTLYCFAPLAALQFYRDWKTRGVSRGAHPEEPRRSSAAGD